jgi:hypothetical protein
MWSFKRKPKPEDAVVPEMKFWDVNLGLTPDLNQLTQKPYQRVFVCDEMMKPFHRHCHLKEIIAPELKDHGPVYAYTRQVFGVAHYVPAKSIIPIRRKFANIPLARIKGELYAVESEKIPLLDNLKQNGLQFQRERVRLLLPYRHYREYWGKERDMYERVLQVSPLKEDCSISAWMYIGLPEFFEQLMLEHTEERDGAMYFTKKYAMRENGLFLPKTTKHYRAVNVYKPGNHQMQISVKEYYYYTRDQLNTG